MGDNVLLFDTLDNMTVDDNGNADTEGIELPLTQPEEQVEIVTGNPGVSPGLPAPVPQQNPYPLGGYGFCWGTGQGFSGFNRYGVRVKGIAGTETCTGLEHRYSIFN